jgi:hypothetical protein
MVNSDAIIDSIEKDAYLIKGRINIICKLDFCYSPIALTCQMRQKVKSYGCNKIIKANCIDDLIFNQTNKYTKWLNSPLLLDQCQTQ